MDDISDKFAPLTDDERAAARPKAAPDDEWMVVMSVPTPANSSRPEVVWKVGNAWKQRALAWRDDLLKRYPLEFESGYFQGFTGEDATAYPDGFHSWVLERRNAFFAGWNLGYVERDDEGGSDDE